MSVSISCVLLVIVIVAADAYGDAAENRIVGGNVAEAGQFPYQVSLRKRSLVWNSEIGANESTYLHICSGSILTSRWIITTAQCIQPPFSVRNFLIVAAAHHIHTDGSRYPLDTIVSYPGYASKISPFKNNIGLVRTRRTIYFNARVQPIALDRKFVNEGVPAVVSGWGYLNAVFTHPHLSFEQVFTLSNEECLDRYDKEDVKRIYHTTLCTFIKTGRSTCILDSGGPLVMNNYLVGLATGQSQCKQGQADTFTRVAPFADWVLEVTRL